MKDEKPWLRTSVRPLRLRPGDTVGIAAPASPFDEEAFARGVRVLEDMGYRIHLPEDLFTRCGYFAGHDRRRAAQLLALFKNPNIKGIFCARGGYGCLRILPLLDYDLIRCCPKVVVGFSDITALHAALYHCCRLVTFHGPVVTSLGRIPPGACDALAAFLAGGEAQRLAFQNPRVIRAGSASGVVLGGNLAVLCSLAGTPFSPDLSGAILFLEDVHEKPYRIDRMLTQMRLAGCFQNLAGLVLGVFRDCGGMDAICTIVKDVFSTLEIPILAGLSAGHGEDNRTLALGLEARLDTASATLSYARAATRRPDEKVLEPAAKPGGKD